MEVKFSKCLDTLEKTKEILKRQEQWNSYHQSIKTRLEPTQRNLQCLGFHCANAVFLFQPVWTINHNFKVHIEVKDRTVFFNTTSPTAASIPIITLVGCCKHSAGHEPFWSTCDVQVALTKQTLPVILQLYSQSLVQVSRHFWFNSDLQHSQTAFSAITIL